MKEKTLTFHGLSARENPGHYSITISTMNDFCKSKTWYTYENVKLPSTWSTYIRKIVVIFHVIHWSWGISFSNFVYLIEVLDGFSTNWPKLTWLCVRTRTYIHISVYLSTFRFDNVISFWPLLLATPKISFSFV